LLTASDGDVSFSAEAGAGQRLHNIDTIASLMAALLRIFHCYSGIAQSVRHGNRRLLLTARL
jgi:hypothetical protein